MGARLLTIALAFVTFWYGLASSQVASINVAEGNFNTFPVRCVVVKFTYYNAEK